MSDSHRRRWIFSQFAIVVSALAGVGVAVGGKDAVNWGWNDGKGLGTIFAGFIIVSFRSCLPVFQLTKFTGPWHLSGFFFHSIPTHEIPCSPAQELPARWLHRRARLLLHSYSNHDYGHQYVIQLLYIEQC